MDAERSNYILLPEHHPGTKRSLSFPPRMKWKRCFYSTWPREESNARNSKDLSHCSLFEKEQKCSRLMEMIRLIKKRESVHIGYRHESIQNGCRAFQLHSASGAPPRHETFSFIPSQNEMETLLLFAVASGRKQSEKQQKISRIVLSLKKNRNAADLWKWYGAKASCYLYCTVRRFCG
ncbi:hypothetical protein CEXT_307921 [Caerostris extrusa]|uniref:Uncharacterized protein n=1 Tax=Caerostris extrusa TaxID=172846 RepID=A0AAV4VUR7_CAEEX|nr:hypothetical protein CEXT_307921 [Caerostris extrusa]